MSDNNDPPSQGQAADLQPASRPDELNVERALRPRTLAEYVGQIEMCGTITVMIEASRRRAQAMDHVMLYGPPGLGKTTMAHVIANELGVRAQTTSGPAIEHSGQLASILVSLQPGDVLFIDEIHRLSTALEEMLYGALEDQRIDIVSGATGSEKILAIPLPAFTCIGATTRAGSITGPLRDRFGASFRLNFYNPDELAQVVRASASRLGLKIESAAVELLARRSRGTPRIANRLLRRSADEALVSDKLSIDADSAARMMDRLDIDELGLDAADRQYLTVLAETFSGGPAGLGALAAALAEDTATLEDVVEPYLLRGGLIARTHKGRMLSKDGRAHLSIR